MFLNDDFLLTTDTARKLFHQHAKDMPIIDYHCHLDPKEIYDNQNFRNLTEAWLAGDHYKWRLMRANGIPESHITGDASDYDKFLAWARTVPKTVGNPLYSWTHLELRRFFGITELLNEESAPRIWEQVNAKLATDDFRRRNIIKNSGVKVVCTTDDPADSLAYHQLLKKEDTGFRVFPAFRPDKALNIDAPGFTDWLERLAQASGQQVTTYAELLDALKQRIDFFHEQDCRLSDHAIDVLRYQEGSAEELERIFAKRVAGETLSLEEITVYRTELLSALIGLYHSKNWTMQLHIHAFRNNNTPMFKRLGPDTGYDALNDLPLAGPLVPAARPCRMRPGTAEDDFVFTQPERLSRPSDSDGLLSKGYGRQIPARFRMVVQRHAQRHASSAHPACRQQPAGQLRRHADRLPQLPFLYPARIFPPRAV